MAGLPWFKVDADFPEHPKTVRLAARMRDPNAGMYVVRLLSYCARYAPDGRISADMLEHAAGWSKRSGPAGEALIEAGFIERDGDHFLVHGWEDRNGAHARKAAKDARKPRGNLPRPADVPPPSPAGPTRDIERVPPMSRAGELEGEGDREKKKILSARPLATEPTGGRARERVHLGIATADLLARTAAGLGIALAPFTSQHDADEFEQRIGLFARGEDEALEYVAATCRKRTRKPESAKVLLLMLRDLAPEVLAS